MFLFVAVINVKSTKVFFISFYLVCHTKWTQTTISLLFNLPLSLSLSFAVRQIQCEKQINFVRLYRSCWCVFLCTSAAIMAWCYISSHSFSLFAAQATKLIELPKSQSRNTSLSTLWLGYSDSKFLWNEGESGRRRHRKRYSKETEG